MTPRQFRFAFRTLSFLDAHRENPSGVIELRARRPRRLVVWDPDAIVSIFHQDRHLYHEPSRTLAPLLGRKSLLWAEGVRHASYRRLLGPPLQGRQLEHYHNLIVDTIDAAIDKLVAGTEFSPIAWTREVTLNIISRIVLGHADDLLLHQLSTWLENRLGSRCHTLIYRFLRPDPPSPSPRRPFLSTCHKLDRMLLRSATTAKSAHPSALVTRLLTADGPLGSLPNDELRDQIVSLLFAGHETTASAAAWTLYWLHSDEQLRREVTAELSATSSEGADPTQVPLLQAAIQEALRRCPPAITAGKRVLTTECHILGESLPVGTVLTPCMYLAHHRADIFPNPQRFNPGRFLENRFSRRYYFPFGGGTRRCLGSELAMLEIRMIIAALMRRYGLSCVNPEAAVPQLRGPTLTLPRQLKMSVIAAPSSPRAILR